MLKGVARASGPLARWGGYYLSAEKDHNGGYFTVNDDFAIDRYTLFGKLTFVPDTKSFGSVSMNHVRSDDSTPTNEPVVDGRYLSDIDPRFDRLSNLNITGPNYHQGEDRLTVNFTRQIAPWARAVEVFGFRDIQVQVHRRRRRHRIAVRPGDPDVHHVSVRAADRRARALPGVPGRDGADARPASKLDVVGGSYERNSGSSSGNLIYTDEETLGWPINYLRPIIPPETDWQFDPFGGVKYNLGNFALFGQYLFEPADRWVLTAGGRYDRFDLDNTNVRLSRPKVEATFSAFSPKLSATYRLLRADGQGRAEVDLLRHIFSGVRASTEGEPTDAGQRGVHARAGGREQL